MGVHVPLDPKVLAALAALGDPAVMAELEKLQALAPVSPLTLEELWRQYERWGAEHIPSWKKTYSHRKPFLLGHFGGRPWTEITPPLADAYIELRRKQRTIFHRPVMDGTINLELAVLRGCLNWCVKRRLISHNPLAGYPALAPRYGTVRTSRKKKLALGGKLLSRG